MYELKHVQGKKKLSSIVLTYFIEAAKNAMLEVTIKLNYSFSALDF